MIGPLPLAGGTSIPQIGLGLWQVPGADVGSTVAAALDAGYRGFDTAPAYGNERSLGTAIARSDLPREDVFISTKLGNADQGRDRVRRAFDISLKELGLDWVDLYLIHWPLPMRDQYVDTWRVLEELQSEGRARAIGVSNFTAAHLSRLQQECDVVPAVNQVEVHPRFQQRELRRFHVEHGIVTQAWSPLGSGRGLLRAPVLAELAARHGCTPAQVVIAWHLRQGMALIPKSATPQHIAENVAAPDLDLSDEDASAIDALDGRRRLGPNPDTFDYS